MRQVAPPYGQAIDIAAEFAALRTLMERLILSDFSELNRALNDAGEEAARPAPDKAEVAGALERAVEASKNATNFTQNVTEIGDCVVRIVGWLGPSAGSVLTLLGLRDR